MTAKKAKLGFIGAGFFGQLAHLSVFAEVEDCELHALCSKAEHRRQAVMKKFKIKHGFADYRELLADPKLDAVVIVTPRPLLAPLALECLQAGKHVLCEKPMAGSHEQANRLVKAAAERGVKLMIGYMKRHDAGVKMARELIRKFNSSGELGQITFARAHLFGGKAYVDTDGTVALDERSALDADLAWPTAPEKFSAREANVFAKLNNSVSHNINLLRYLLGGSFKTVGASLGESGAQVLTFSTDNIPAVVEFGELQHEGWDEVTEVFFEKGRVRIETPAPLKRNTPATVKLYRENSEAIVFSPEVSQSWAFSEQAQAFVNLVLGRGENLASGEDSLQDILLLEEAFKKGQWR